MFYLYYCTSIYVYTKCILGGGGVKGTITIGAGWDNPISNPIWYVLYLQYVHQYDVKYICLCFMQQYRSGRGKHE